MGRKNYLIDTNVTIRIREIFNIKLPDSIIAATCLLNKASLITNNVEDFDQIPGLHLIKV